MTSWKCEKCGYTLEAKTPPGECPACKAKCQFVDNTCYTPDCVTKGGIDPRVASKKQD